jgi:Trp operon repressor
LNNAATIFTANFVKNSSFAAYFLAMLYQLFRSAQTDAEFEQLLSLTFTEHERAMMTERWKIFEALDRGLSQREVAREVPCSIVTATRGAKVYREHQEKIQELLKIWRMSE